MLTVAHPTFPSSCDVHTQPANAKIAKDAKGKCTPACAVAWTYVCCLAVD